MARPFISMESFALRQFQQGSSSYVDYSPEEFTTEINRIWRTRTDESNGADALRPGYAPFCKHIFVPNFTPATAYAIAITPDNEHLLRSDYLARTANELPVLTRWFPKAAVAVPRATFLDIILYSREQIVKENAATGEANTSDSPWGIISIKAQMIDHEIPMGPITMMRNALPLREGGSGVALDRDNYAKSVQVWKEFAIVT